MTAASCQAVSKVFGSNAPALQSVSIALSAGEITGLVGPDGAGKTTLMRILAGLMVPDGGAALVFGRPPQDALDDIGYMPQRFGLYEDLTVQENLLLHARLRKLPEHVRSERFAELLAFTDLARFTTRAAGKMSGGMKQKLGLACALIGRPRLLLLDEPGVGVDPISRRELWAMVERLKDDGIAVLWSTAYMDEAERCDRVHLLNEGCLLFSGPPAELTAEAAGRVFAITDYADDRRSALHRWMQRPGVVDGTIQGNALRLLARSGETLAGAEPGLTITPAPAQLEDGFIERLGGAPKGDSALAARYHQRAGLGGPLIVAEGLTKRFGDFVAARDISFSVPAGSIFGLLGPNGAGKSTSFKMLCGLLRPSAGRGFVAGHDLQKGAAKARGSLGYMAQKFSLYGELSVGQNLDFFAGAYDLSGKAAASAKDAMIAIFDLEAMLSTNAGMLPLGFKQRLALACAVMHEPPVLFLDEPTSGVDPVMRREFWNHINGLVGKGVAVLVTTHFMEEAEYCDAISLIYRGEQIANGSPDMLKAQTARLTGQANPSMADAFVALIEASDTAQAQAAA